MFDPVESALSRKSSSTTSILSARVSALELSLGSCVETFASLVHVVKGVKLFDFCDGRRAIAVTTYVPLLVQVGCACRIKEGVCKCAQ